MKSKKLQTKKSTYKRIKSKRIKKSHKNINKINNIKNNKKSVKKGGVNWVTNYFNKRQTKRYSEALRKAKLSYLKKKSKNIANKYQILENDILKKLDNLKLLDNNLNMTNNKSKTAEKKKMIIKQFLYFLKDYINKDSSNDDIIRYVKKLLKLNDNELDILEAIILNKNIKKLSIDTIFNINKLIIKHQQLNNDNDIEFIINFCNIYSSINYIYIDQVKFINFLLEIELYDKFKDYWNKKTNKIKVEDGFERSIYLSYLKKEKTNKAIRNKAIQQEINRIKTIHERESILKAEEEEARLKAEEEYRLKAEEEAAAAAEAEAAAAAEAEAEAARLKEEAVAARLKAEAEVEAEEEEEEEEEEEAAARLKEEAAAARLKAEEEATILKKISEIETYFNSRATGYYDYTEFINSNDNIDKKLVYTLASMAKVSFKTDFKKLYDIIFNLKKQYEVDEYILFPYIIKFGLILKDSFIKYKDILIYKPNNNIKKLSLESDDYNLFDINTFNMGIEIETCIDLKKHTKPAKNNQMRRLFEQPFKYFSIVKDKSIECKKKQSNKLNDILTPFEFIFTRKYLDNRLPKEYFTSTEFNENTELREEIIRIENMSTDEKEIPNNLNKNINSKYKINCRPATCGLHYHVSCDSIRYSLQGTLFLLHLVKLWESKYENIFLEQLNYQQTLLGKTYSKKLILFDPVRKIIDKYIEVLKEVIKEHKNSELNNIDNVNSLPYTIITSLSYYLEKILHRPFFFIVNDNNFIHIEFRGMHPAQIIKNTETFIILINQLYNDANNLVVKDISTL